MYVMTPELIAKLSEILQTGKSAPSYKVTIFKKAGDKNYEPYPIALPEITRVTVDRRWNMAADEISVSMTNINGFYSPEYAEWKVFTGVDELPMSGFHGVIAAWNRVLVELGYGDSIIRTFTGEIQKVDISERPPSIKFTALNEYRKLLKPIDPIDKRELIYENKPAFEIIMDLLKRAGIDEHELDIEFVLDENGEVYNDFVISDMRLPLGYLYAEAIRTLLGIMNHRIYGDRHGRLRIIRNETYTQQDFHNWEFFALWDLGCRFLACLIILLMQPRWSRDSVKTRR